MMLDGPGATVTYSGCHLRVTVRGIYHRGGGSSTFLGMTSTTPGSGVCPLTSPCSLGRERRLRLVHRGDTRPEGAKSPGTRMPMIWVNPRSASRRNVAYSRKCDGIEGADF